VVAPQSLRQPSVPMHRDAPRYRGVERKLIEGASLGANVLCAGQGPARPRPVLRPSACSAGLRTLPRSRLDGTAPCLPPCSSRSFLSVSAASSAAISTPSGEATSRRRGLPRNPKLSGTRRPSPDPHPQLLRGWRRLVSTPPTPSKPTPSGTRRPSPNPQHNYFGVGDVPAPIQTQIVSGGGDVSSPHLPRPRNPKLSGTRRPSPYPAPQLLRHWRRPVSKTPMPHNARHSSGLPLPFPDPSSKP